MGQAAKTRKIFDNRYEILSIVGRSRYSVVYHAAHIMAPSSEVALKVLIAKDEQKSAAERLRKEALAMVSSRHRYVVRLDDFHSMGDLCYLSMEFAPESDLRKYVAAGGSVLPASQGELFLAQTAEALACVHKAGIVHRDVKPDNILVMNDREIRLADFSVSLLPGEESSFEELQGGVGSMDYMAPEVLDGKAGDLRSDLYALGVSFYELLSGKHPFANAPLAKQLEARRDGKFPSLADVAPHVPSYLNEVVSKLMRYDPAQRHQNAGDLVQILAASRGKDSGRRKSVIAPRTPSTKGSGGVKSEQAEAPPRQAAADVPVASAASSLVASAPTSQVTAGASPLASAKESRAVPSDTLVVKQGDLPAVSSAPPPNSSAGTKSGGTPTAAPTARPTPVAPTTAAAVAVHAPMRTETILNKERVTTTSPSAEAPAAAPQTPRAAKKKPSAGLTQTRYSRQIERGEAPKRLGDLADATSPYEQKVSKAISPTTHTEEERELATAETQRLESAIAALRAQRKGNPPSAAATMPPETAPPTQQPDNDASSVAAPALIRTRQSEGSPADESAAPEGIHIPLPTPYSPPVAAKLEPVAQERTESPRKPTKTEQIDHSLVEMIRAERNKVASSLASKELTRARSAEPQPVVGPGPARKKQGSSAGTKSPHPIPALARARLLKLALISGVVVCVVTVVVVLLSSPQSGTPRNTLGKGARGEKQPVSGEQLNDSQKTESALLFPNLPYGMYTGTIENILPGVNASLGVLSMRGEKLAVVIGIEGWTPAVVTVPAPPTSRVGAENAGAPQSGSADEAAPIRVAANGFVLEFTGQPANGGVQGVFFNRVTGEEGTWFIKPRKEQKEDK